MRKLTHLLLALALCGLLTAAPLAAQEAEASAAAEATPPGISTLVLLMGLGAVVVVGGIWLARDNFKPGDEGE